MSNSPFEIFRRNLKPLMVFLTLLALLSFVVLPVVQTYLQQQAGTGGGANAVVASFAGMELTQSRVDYFTRNHNSMLRVLRELAEETINRGGIPRTPGFRYDAQNKQIQSIGINESPSISTTIGTFMYANEARKAGFELDDSSLSRWLEAFTDGMISESEITARLMQSTRNEMGRPHLYEQLRNHLLAGVYLRRGSAALIGNTGALLTPQEQWTNFLKLNQSATASAYGVLVSDFLDQTNKSPSDAKIEEVFEEGKERGPNDQSPEPAFYRPYSAKFEYLVGDYQDYLDIEVAKLTEEELRAEYKKRLEGGAFELPAEEQEKPASDEPATEEPASAAEMETEAAPAQNKASSEDAAPKSATETDADPAAATEPAAADEMKTDEPSANEKADAAEEASVDEKSKAEETASEPADKGEPADKVAEEKPISEKTEADAPKPDDPKTESPNAEKPSGDDSSQTLRNSGGEIAVRLVAMQADDAKDATDGSESNDEPDSEDDPKSESDESTAEPTAEESDTASDSPKVKTFEDVRDQIAEDLAGPAAQRAMDAAVTKANSVMKSYFSKMAIHQSNLAIGKADDPPKRPDLAALAKEIGMKREAIGPYTQQSIADEPIAQSFELGTQFNRGVGFPIMMYGFEGPGGSIPPQPLFAAMRTADDQRGKIYVSWKVEETEAYVPTLEQAREEVIMAIRTQEARELAKKKAEELAKQAADAGSLAEVVPDDRKDNLNENLDPFTWMESFGFSGASIGNVPKLDSVAEEFMEAVFTSEVGGYAVAANAPQRVYYVVTPTNFEPSIEELREQFKQPFNRTMARMVQTNLGEVIQGFREAVESENEFEVFIDP